MIKSFYTDILQNGPSFHSLLPIKSLDLLFPAFRTAVEAVLDEAKKAGHPMMVFETFRSTDRQIELYKQHLTELKNVGVHHYGLAADICFLDSSGTSSWKGDFTLLGKFAKNQNLVWGGDWGHPEKPHTFRDWDHVQFISVADQNKLFDGSWYPDENYKVEG